ncbi:MAG: peptide chain release factor N(5)-glutamine methyltransferase [Oscillospiraceae bacterium]|nr:peptide chain release factor N(5)-glutamine methyltransferase [Oscillospiraceae bacterium]
MVNGFYSLAKKALSENGFEEAVFEARLICCKAFGITENKLLSKNAVCNDNSALENAEKMLSKRLEHYPLQYILGQWEFFGLQFSVDKGVLIPRADTEVLVETALEIINDKKLNVIDLCSGSGCIAIALKKHSSCKICAVELSDDALRVLKHNAKENGADIEIIKGDVCDGGFAQNFGDIDIIVSNPPYLTSEDMENLQAEVKFEPECALFGGDDGLDFYRNITKVWKSALKCGGYIIFEVGMNQSADVCKILEENGFKVKKCVNDLNGIERVVCAQLN